MKQPGPSKYARIERERRFLLRAPPAELDRAEFARLHDLYIARTRLRLRHVTSPDGRTLDCKLTQKVDTAPARRIITTIYLDADEFERFDALPGARLSKRRYVWRWNDETYGIDVFEGALSGLVLAEIEFADDAGLAASTLPEFAVCEVTERPEFTGAALANCDPAGVHALIGTLLRLPGEHP